MKKILSIVALLAISLVNAQDFKSKRGENMLPEQGDWALGFSTDGLFEYVGNAFNGDTNNGAPTLGISNTTDNGFNGRFVGKYFTSDKSAYRVVFNLQLQSTGNKLENTTPDPLTTTVTDPVTVIPPATPLTTIITSNEEKNINTEFSIGLGKEWRRGKTRLQGFYGADALLFFSTGSFTETDNTDTTVKVATPASTVRTVVNIEDKQKDGFGFGLGLEGFIGAEYFLFPKIAIGAQYTYAARIFSKGAGVNTKITTTTFENSVTAPPIKSQVKTEEANTRSNSDYGLNGVGIVSINLTLHF